MEEKKDKYGKYLPIGSIVKLKSATKKLMVTGFCMYDNDGERTLYDYCGCPYPEGMLSNKEAHLFNHDDIEEICHLGVSDDEDKQFKINLTSLIQIIQTVDNEEVSITQSEIQSIESTN